MRKRFVAAAATCVAIAAVLAAPAAYAGTATGSSALTGAPLAGGYVDADLSVTSAAPVVAYDYAVVNQCWFGAKTNGPSDSTQRDPIVDWVYSSPPTHGDIPHATMSLDLTSVPAGATCRVWIAYGNTQVKGSVTTYAVH